MKNLYNKSGKVKKLFNFDKKPTKNLLLFRLLATVGSVFALIGRGLKIEKKGLKDIKGPFILLPNHSNFTDYFVIFKALFPRRVSWCSGVEGFNKNELGLRGLGGFPKRRYLNDNVAMVRNIKYCLEKLHQSVILFPEGHYSMDGRLGEIPESFAKILKLINYPVVTCKMEGNYIAMPFWNPRIRRNTRLKATLTCLYTPQQLKEASVSEIHKNLLEHLNVDDFKYQIANNVKIKYKLNAEGLERLLYKCPCCKSEFEMQTLGNLLTCSHCGKAYNLTQLNELSASAGVTEFSSIADWLSWQREEVKKELKNKKFKLESEVDVHWLPNAKGFVKLGTSNFIFTKEGYKFSFDRRGEKIEIDRPALDTFSIHLELRYVDDRDALDIGAQDSSYFIYFNNDKPGFATKVKLAVEEAHHIASLEAKKRAKS